MQTPDVPFVLTAIPVDDLAEQVSRSTSEALLATLPEAVRRARLGTYLNDKQASEETGLSKRQLRYLREQRRVEYRKVGKTLLYPTAKLFELIDAGAVPVRETA